MDKKEIEELRKIIEKEEYNCYGIRVDYDMVYKVGDICENSHQWWQDCPEDPEETELEYNEDMQAWDGGELQGTCALLVECADDLEEILEQSNMYLDDNVTLIAGNSYEGGNDIGEAIIENAVVLAIV